MTSFDIFRVHARKFIELRAMPFLSSTQYIQTKSEIFQKMSMFEHLKKPSSSELKIAFDLSLERS